MGAILSTSGLYPPCLQNPHACVCTACVCLFRPRTKCDIEMDNVFLIADYEVGVCMCILRGAFVGIESLRQEKAAM